MSKERKILIMSFIGGLIFSLSEFIFAIYSNSQSALMDAVYDASELVFIALIIFLTPLFHKPISEKYPYGFFQIESIFLIVKGFMLISVTFAISAEIIKTMLTGGNYVNTLDVAIFQFILAIISILIFLVMKKLNNKLSSPTVDAEILSWKIDIFYSVGMSFAFFVSTILVNTKFKSISSYIDSIIAIFITIFMLPEVFKIIWTSMKDVFLFSPDEMTVSKIKNICENVLKETKFNIVSFDINRTGRYLWIVVYFKISSDKLYIDELKKATDVLNDKLRDEFVNCTCELVLLP